MDQNLRSRPSSAGTSAAGVARTPLVAAIVLLLASAAHAQPAAPAGAGPFLPIGSAVPLDRPLQLRPQFVPEFSFVTESLNLGRSAPGSLQRVILAGRGTVAPRANVTIFRLWIDRLHLDGRDFGGGQPFVLVDGEIQPGPQKFRTLAIDTTGYSQFPASGIGVAPSQVIRQATEAFLDGMFLPPRGSVAMATPIVDISPALQRDLTRMMPYAALTRAIAPAAIVGARTHDGRPVLVAALRDELQLNVAGQAVALTLESEFLIDQETALPLVIRTRIWGAPNAPPLAGPVDYVVRTFVSLPGMQEPMTQLAAPPIPTTAPELPLEGPPPAELPAPKKPAVAKPAPPTAAPAKPIASPAKPAPPAPAATPSDDVAARLQTLKGLFERGLITQEQYEAKQKEILGRL